MPKIQKIPTHTPYIYTVVYLFGVPPLAVGATTCQFVAYTPHGRVGICSGQPAWPAASSSDGSILKAVHNVELCVCVCVDIARMLRSAVQFPAKWSRCVCLCARDRLMVCQLLNYLLKSRSYVQAGWQSC